MEFHKERAIIGIDFGQRDDRLAISYGRLVQRNGKMIYEFEIFKGYLRCEISDANREAWK